MRPKAPQTRRSSRKEYFDIKIFLVRTGKRGIRKNILPFCHIFTVLKKSIGGIIDFVDYISISRRK
ncbi:MAG: hypothetical protein LBU28_01065, partial [Spirochaetaceae bacterium]|nr:hypothetical protein [Spirochaetaceae bacterium]